MVTDNCSVPVNSQIFMSERWPKALLCHDATHNALWPMPDVAVLILSPMLHNKIEMLNAKS